MPLRIKPVFAPPKVKITYTIKKTWELPDILNEISGMVWLEDNKIACVQDENGIIFIYDLKTKKISDQVEFDDAGDFEAITIAGKDAYIMRSDGLIYEIRDFRGPDKQVSSFKTKFSEDNNMETLTYYRETNSLLTVPKDRDLNYENIKGIYEIPLKTRRIKANPLYQIDMKSPKFKEFAQNKVSKTFNPSDMAIHPKTGDLYLLDGKYPKLLVLDPKGAPKKVHSFKEGDFPQPEGITFSPDGTLYISNEAHKGSATLHEVKLN